VPLLQSLQQHAVLQPADSLTSSGTSSSSNGSLVLQQLPEVQQLLLWQGCLDSFDASALAGPCWQEMFAYNLLAGALRAFGYSYMAVRGIGSSACVVAASVPLRHAYYVLAYTVLPGMLLYTQHVPVAKVLHALCCTVCTGSSSLLS
jgi:hypothetical protein